PRRRSWMRWSGPSARRARERRARRPADHVRGARARERAGRRARGGRPRHRARVRADRFRAGHRVRAAATLARMLPGVATGCFISTGRSLPDAVERVKLAESLGYEAVYITHVAGRESLTVLTVYAQQTERIRIGTGVVPIYTRTPATMAQTAATIDELSGGRLNLGLGVSHRPVVEGWHGQTIDRPVAEMRE